MCSLVGEDSYQFGRIFSDQTKEQEAGREKTQSEKKITADIKGNLKLKGSFERWEKLLSKNLGMKKVVGKEKGKNPEVGSK